MPEMSYYSVACICFHEISIPNFRDYFNTFLDMSVEWKPNGTGNSFEASDRSSGEKIRTATRADLVFGSNSQLRAICEVYASSDANEKFTSDFISAWNKVMSNDLF